MYLSTFGDNTLFPEPSAFTLADKDFLTGKSIQVLKSFKRKEKIAHITGEVNDIISPDSVQIGPEQHLHDPYVLGMLTHSCDPNTYFDVKNRHLVAAKSILENEFLTIDYTQTEDYLFRQFQCRCKTAKCKGWIHGRKEAQVKRSEGGEI
ncbi:hypothetical protein [Marinicella sp. W31]|uniref:hypothetical protein n=1 Tax=Marinicella sp. W31 TaxID=3023713 RepID=UPI003756D2E9